MTTLVFGGMFDPPHIGHVRLLEGAKRHFGEKRALVLVASDPGHREVVASALDRLGLARAAFPGEDVELDEHPRTVDMLRARQLEDPTLILGADELAAFPDWKEPETVLELARLAVGERPGYSVGTCAPLVVPSSQPKNAIGRIAWWAVMDSNHRPAD